MTMTHDVTKDEDYEEYFVCVGKTVKRVYYNVTSNGYPYTTVEFTDGSAFTTLEQGQTGYISCGFTPCTEEPHNPDCPATDGFGCRCGE